MFPFLFLLVFGFSISNVTSSPGAGSAGSRRWLWGPAVSPPHGPCHPPHLWRCREIESASSIFSRLSSELSLGFLAVPPAGLSVMGGMRTGCVNGRGTCVPPGNGQWIDLTFCCKEMVRCQPNEGRRSRAVPLPRGRRLHNRISQAGGDTPGCFTTGRSALTTAALPTRV